MGDAQLLFALANFILCVIAAGMCLCRLNIMQRGVLFRVRSEYALYLTCALASAFQPLWGEWPEWGSLAMAGGLVFGLVSSSKFWERGAPRDAMGQE